MKRLCLAATLLVALTACKNGNLNAPGARLEVRKVTSDTVQFVPTKGQLPYCLIFTRAANGVLRQMTMTLSNRSVDCPEGKPVMGETYKIPPGEGAVKILAFFSNKRINAGSIAEQLFEKPDASPIDLRLPGDVSAQTLSFTPTAEATAPTAGGVVGPGGAVKTADGGVSQATVAPQYTGADGGSPAADNKPAPNK